MPTILSSFNGSLLLTPGRGADLNPNNPLAARNLSNLLTTTNTTFNLLNEPTRSLG